MFAQPGINKIEAVEVDNEFVCVGFVDVEEGRADLPFVSLTQAHFPRAVRTSLATCRRLATDSRALCSVPGGDLFTYLITRTRLDAPEGTLFTLPPPPCLPNSARPPPPQPNGSSTSSSKHSSTSTTSSESRIGTSSLRT